MGATQSSESESWGRREHSNTTSRPSPSAIATYCPKRGSKVTPLGQRISAGVGRVIAAGASIRDTLIGNPSKRDRLSLESVPGDVYTSIWGQKTQDPIPADTVRAIDDIIAEGKSQAADSDPFERRTSKTFARQLVEDRFGRNTGAAPSELYDPSARRGKAASGSVRGSAIRPPSVSRGSRRDSRTKGSGRSQNGQNGLRVENFLRLLPGRRSQAGGAAFVSSIPSAQEVITKAATAALAAQAAAAAAAAATANPSVLSRFFSGFSGLSMGPGQGQGLQTLESNAAQSYSALTQGPASCGTGPAAAPLASGSTFSSAVFRGRNVGRAARGPARPTWTGGDGSASPGSSGSGSPPGQPARRSSGSAIPRAQAAQAPPEPPSVTWPEAKRASGRDHRMSRYYRGYQAGAGSELDASNSKPGFLRSRWFGRMRLNQGLQ